MTSGGLQRVFTGRVVMVAGEHLMGAADIGRTRAVIAPPAVQLEGITMPEAVGGEVFIPTGAVLREKNGGSYASEESAYTCSGSGL